MYWAAARLDTAMSGWDEQDGYQEAGTGTSPVALQAVLDHGVGFNELRLL